MRRRSPGMHVNYAETVLPMHDGLGSFGLPAAVAALWSPRQRVLHQRNKQIYPASFGKFRLRAACMRRSRHATCCRGRR